MDELLALQRELAEVQSAPSVYRLSEPNVVEVMMKLADLGLVEVVYTSNGKEYLTPKQLRNELADEILAHNGRINVTELAPILNVDLSHVEHAADELLRRDDGLQLFQGELIASYYLDSLAEEINQTLQGAGRVTLAELAVQHTLPTDFVQKLIEPRLGTVVQAKLAAGVLYTSAYVARHAARVRGALCAVLRPISLSQLIRDHGFNETLFYDCVEALKTARTLPGRVQGKSSYTPAVHAHAQVAGVRTFFEQNGIIEYASLRAMAGVRDPKSYLEQTYPGGIPLSTCYMKREMLGALEVELDEACANGSAIDVRASFSHEMSDDDVAAMLDASASIKAALAGGRAVRLSGGALLASAALLTASGEGGAIDELVTTSAEREFQKGQGKPDAAAAKAAGGGGKAAKGGGKKGGGKEEEDDEDEGGGKSRAKGGGKRGKAAARDQMLLEGGALDDSDDDELAGGKKGKAKKGKKGKAAGGGGGGAAEAAEADADDAGGDDASSDALLEGVEAAVLAARPALEEIPELSLALARHHLPAVRARVAAAVSAKREAGAGERRKALQQAQESIGLLATNCHLFAKGAASLDMPPKEAEALDKAMLKGCCTELVVALIYSETMHAGLQPSPALTDGASGGGAFSAAERKESLTRLPGPPQRALSELEKALAAKGSVAAFLEALKLAEATLGAQCPPLDKKREKAAAERARAAFRTQLAAEAEPGVVLHLTVLLLHLDLNGAMLEAPGRLLPPLIDALEPKLAEGPRGTLLAYAKSAHEVLQGGEGAQGAADELRGGLEAVRGIGMSGGRGE